MMSTGNYVPYPPKDPIAEKFEDFVDGLMEEGGEIDLATREKLEKASGVQKATIDLANKQELYQKANDILHEYAHIKREVEVKLAQRAAELNGKASNGTGGGKKIEGNITKAKTLAASLTTELNKTIACIKTANKKISLVLDKANDLERIIKDPCNADELRDLNKRCGSLAAEAQKLTEKALHVCNMSNASFDTAVKTAGINALVKTESLVKVGGNIQKYINAFSTNVDGCLEEVSTNLGEARTAYFSAIRDLCHYQDDYKVAHLKLNAFELLKQFAEPGADRNIEKPIDDLVREAKKNFDTVIEVEGPTTEEKNQSH